MFTIRPFQKTDADYEAVVAIHNAVWTDDIYSVHEWRYQEEMIDSKYFYQRFLVTMNEQVVAFGDCHETWWSYRVGKYRIKIEVHPDYEGYRIASRLYEQLMLTLQEEAPHAPVMLTADSREDKTNQLRFLCEHGFEQVMREPISRLEVAAFDERQFAGAVQKAMQAGIKIQTISQLEQLDPAWKRKLWELRWHILQDIPAPQARTGEPLAEFEKRLHGHPNFNPDAWFIALDEGEYVAYSYLHVTKSMPEKLFTGITGVKRSHRRRGIATALKVRGIAFAKAYGAKVIQTENEENNPMFQLNMQLGFEPAPAWVRFEKHL